MPQCHQMSGVIEGSADAEMVKEQVADEIHEKAKWLGYKIKGINKVMTWEFL